MSGWWIEKKKRGMMASVGISTGCEDFVDIVIATGQRRAKGERSEHSRVESRD